MNTKRQTVWLVSMLSLMVVLSAYYLFSDNKDQLETASEDMNFAEISAAEVDRELDGDTAEVVVDDDELSADDAILEKMEAETVSGDEDFISLQLQRGDEFRIRTDELMEIITEKNQDVEAIANAEEEIRNIEEKEAKLINLEDQLMVEFENAIILEESNKYKVTVQTETMEKSQAVSIVDMVMKEMNVGPDKIIVQYIH